MNGGSNMDEAYSLAKKELDQGLHLRAQSYIIMLSDFGFDRILGEYGGLEGLEKSWSALCRTMKPSLPFQNSSKVTYVPGISFNT